MQAWGEGTLPDSGPQLGLVFLLLFEDLLYNKPHKKTKMNLHNTKLAELALITNIPLNAFLWTRINVHYQFASIYIILKY